ncbi:restriction endonuclease [Pseudomonas gingeri]|uniref:nSTAND3 domain-containing NTPase n=1 Tax=Pseudomonas gingeri TaxID=117681 RepID=UPI0015A4CDE4|nr:restriction endonuclease [Pseudomonas gingeri]NVZ63619.1 restriction endonuclease [Pseudomonas gingeri]
MSNYDFKQLSPHDFEQLARDLLQARDGVVLESFKAGRDQGIDFRYACGAGNVIVQCKHYLGTGFSGLMRDLRKEVAKASRLKIFRYILVTSVGLTPSNKDEIQSLFDSILVVGDILGSDDINNLLGAHPKIEQQHYKLWLTSRAMLDRVIHNASLTQSDFDVARVHRDIHKYVRSAAYPRALDMLVNEHVVIISGAPGVGKTSLAKMLLYKYIELGYEAISILTDFQVGRELYQKGKRQIFYFDDFVGATFLGEHAPAFSRNEDRAIIEFVEMVRTSPTAKLIMTTREHILRQAVATSERFKQGGLIDSRCVLSVGDYSRMQRAEILYNHIYFSDLPGDYRSALLSDQFYMEIVQHKKFNPRLIDWLSTFKRIKSSAPEKYQDFVRGLLANPAEIWRHAYEFQISDSARSILLALYTYSGACSSALLERAFYALHGLRAQRYGFQIKPSDWRAGLGELSGSFIRPGKKIEVIDPSVLDMLNAVVRRDTPNALDLIEGAIRFEQLRRIWTFSLDRGSRGVLNYLANESRRVEVAFERLFAAPRKIPVKGGCAHIDDGLEIRVGTMIQAAESLNSSNLFQASVAALNALIVSWESELVDIGSAVELLAKIANSSFVGLSENEGLRSRIIRALVKEASTGCSSDELRDLIVAVKSEKIDKELSADLYTALEFYQEHYFSGELHDCRSVAEFEALDERLKTIAGLMEFDFYSAIESVHGKIGEFENEQAAYEDHMYEEWKDHRHEVMSNDSEIHDIFDSLRESK